MVLGENDQAEVIAVRRGDRASDTLSEFGYRTEELIAAISAGLRDKVADGEITADESLGLLEDYSDRLRHYTYLD